jgi:hypothetical protein
LHLDRNPAWQGVVHWSAGSLGPVPFCRRWISNSLLLLMYMPCLPTLSTQGNGAAVLNLQRCWWHPLEQSVPACGAALHAWLRQAWAPPSAFAPGHACSSKESMRPAVHASTSFFSAQVVTSLQPVLMNWVLHPCCANTSSSRQISAACATLPLAAPGSLLAAPGFQR